MQKYIKIVLNDIELPSLNQFEFFERQVHFYDGLKYELKHNTIYLSYDDENSFSIQVIENLNKFFLPGFQIKKLSSYTFTKDLEKKIIHSINEKIDITVFPYISMFLPVILGNEKYESWYNSNFINIMCDNDKGFYNYTDDRSCFKQILLENSAQYIKSLKFTKESFIKSLFDKYYIYVWIDSCYTGDWNGTKQRHEAHPILIYGVDLEKNLYYCYRFSVLKGIFKCSYDIDIVHLSMESAKCYISDHVDDMHVSIFQTKKILEENLFDKTRFLQELQNYIFSRGNRVKEYCRSEIEITEKTEICLGLNFTRNVIELFKGNVMNTNFDYRMIHLLTEHKHLLHKRFQYVNNLFPFSDIKLTALIDEYYELVLRYDGIKNYYMKESLKESNGYSFYLPPCKKDSVTKIITEYEKLIQSEEILLKIIYDKLNYFLLIYEPNRVANDYCFYAKKRLAADKNGLYQYWEWEECIEIKDISIINLLNQDQRCCQGKLIISDGNSTEIYEPHIHKNGNSIISFTPLQCIKWIKFYPVKYFINENHELGITLRFGEFNILNKAYVISASSVFQVEGLDCSAENMLKENKAFWCPTIADQNRSVIFKFDKPISFNCSVLVEDSSALRILAYKIEYYDNEWKTAVYSEKIKNGYSRIFFDRVTHVCMLRLSIIKTKISPNGYDVPNITNFAVFDLKENI